MGDGRGDRWTGTRAVVCGGSAPSAAARLALPGCGLGEFDVDRLEVVRMAADGSVGGVDRVVAWHGVW